jgi:hypothetical protein
MVISYTGDMMAFWDDWDIELEWDVVGISFAIWAVMGIILFKVPMAFGSMEGFKLFGIPWDIAKTIIWIIALPISYPLTVYLLNRQGD